MTTATKSAQTSTPGPTIDAASTIDEVFLSPRILDRHAFDDYAESLRTLIKDASGQGESLRTATSGVEELREGLRDATGELGKRLEAAIKVLPTLEQHVKTAERLRQEVINPKLIADELRETIDKLIEEKTTEMQARLATLVDRACITIDDQTAKARQQAEELSAKAADALARAQQLLAQSESLARRADDATVNLMSAETRTQHAIADTEARAHAATSSVEAQSRQALADIDHRSITAIGGIETRAQQLMSDTDTRANAALNTIARRHDEAVGTINEASRAIGVQMQGLDRRAEDLSTHAAMIAQQTHERLGAAVQACENAITPLIQRAKGAAQELHDRVESAAHRLAGVAGNDLERLEQLCMRAEALLRDPAGLHSAVTKADELRSDADHAARQFDSIRQQAEQARKLLGEDLNADAARIDAANQQREQAVQATVQLGEQVQQVGAWLSTLITQAHETGKGLEQLASKAKRYGS